MVNYNKEKCNISDGLRENTVHHQTKEQHQNFIKNTCKSIIQTIQKKWAQGRSMQIHRKKLNYSTKHTESYSTSFKIMEMTK